MICTCGNDRFIGHQIIRADVIVGAGGSFLENVTGRLEDSIYDAEKPYGLVYLYGLWQGIRGAGVRMEEDAMRTIIDALYDGNLDFIIGKRGTSAENRKATADLVAIQDELKAALPQDKQDLVEEISMASTTANHLDCKLHFEKGYRLGAMLMLAVFTTPVELEQ